MAVYRVTPHGTREKTSLFSAVNWTPNLIDPVNLKLYAAVPQLTTGSLGDLVMNEPNYVMAGFAIPENTDTIDVGVGPRRCAHGRCQAPVRAKVHVAIGVALFAAVSFAGPVHAADLDINNLPQVDDSKLAASVSDLRVTVQDIRVPEPTDVTTESTDGAEKVLTLNSDILFSFDKASDHSGGGDQGWRARQGPPARGQGQRSVVTRIRSAPTPATSRSRRSVPPAVAAAIKAARPDLVLTVKGFGKAQPVASNGTAAKDDPEGRAKNRRVEIRFAG